MRDRLKLLFAVALVLLGLLSPVTENEEGRSAPRWVVVFDAGHGGVDPGAIGWGGVPEKQITLAIARLIEIYALGDPEVQVVLTRRRDVTLSLRERIDLAHRVGAALYVSIHANAARSPWAQGIETLFHDTAGSSNYAGSVRLARTLQRQLAVKLDSFGVEDRGTKEQRLYLRWARVPAVIVETGFVTNPMGALRLSSLWYQSQVAQAVLAGVKSYLRSH